MIDLSNELTLSQIATALVLIAAALVYIALRRKPRRQKT